MGIKRTFIIGDDWFYVKIYCGVRTSDQVLLDVINSLAASLINQKVIKNWFFIRYSDPDYHLRIRFNLSDTSMLAQLIQSFNSAINPYIETHQVYKVQVDTYEREVERYGSECMALSEKMFYYQSKLIIQFLMKKGDDNDYFLKVLQYLDALLNEFGLDIDEKIEFTIKNAASFKSEYVIDKHNHTQLYKKHKSLSAAFVTLVDPNATFFNQQELISYRSIIREIIHTTTEKNTLLSSYIHMFVNKAFRSQQRFYELVCYDFLSRHYRYIKNR